MQQNQSKKLRLSKKTISNLGWAHMRQINGGGPHVSTYITQFCINTVACNPVFVTSACNPINVGPIIIVR